MYADVLTLRIIWYLDLGHRPVYMVMRHAHICKYCICVRFKVFTAVTMKNGGGVLCDVRRVVLIRTDFSEERIVSIVRVTTIGYLGTTLALTNNRGKRRNISEDAVLYFVFSFYLPSSEPGVRYLYSPKCADEVCP
jgi:hypothetical protein